jgi:hypothetical protein
VAGEFNPVSLLAVPDASQPGWVERSLAEAPRPQSQTSPPASWFDHRGPCAKAPVESPPRDDLDRSRFLDCATHMLPGPVFKPVKSVQKPGPLPLSWTDVEPGLDYVLEIARSSNFVDAIIVQEGPETSATVDFATEGFYYFRLRARLGDDISAPALLALTVSSSGWTIVAPKDFDASALVTVQRGLLRLASASGEMFALLSLPRHYRTAEAVHHAGELRTLGGAFGGAHRAHSA